MFLILAFVLVIFSTVLWAADVKWSAVTVQNDADTDDRIMILDDPNGTAANFMVPRNFFLLDWPGSVNLTTFAPDGVDSDDIADGAIDQLHFAVDVIGVDEMADIDHGDVAWSGGTASVQSMNLGDAGAGTYYLGLFASDTGTVRPIYADAPLAYVQATGTLAATQFSGGGASLTALAGAAITADTITEPAMNTTNAAGVGTDNYVLSYNHAATNFTWVDISGLGGGDMTQAVYDSGASGGVDVLTTVDTVTNTNVLLTETAVGTDGVNTDAALTYDAATGTLASTEFSGGGASLTAIDAATGDSATAFFDAGTIEHEWGGLQADVSGYTGLLAITAADTTAEIDSLDELEGQLADVTRIVTEAVMPVAGTDPDLDAQGELSIDTDGANEPNDVTLRSVMVGAGAVQVCLGQAIKSIQGTVITPNDLADATRDALPIWENNTGMTFVVTVIRAWADTDDTTLNVETVDSDWDNNATVNAIEIATDEVANFSFEDATITAGTITAGSLIVLDFDDTDDPGWVKFNIMGYLIADVD